MGLAEESKKEGFKIRWFIAAVLITGAQSMQAEKNIIESSDVVLSRAIKVRYTNYRGEMAIRLVVPVQIYWGSTQYHPGDQWLLKVWDVERAAERIYAFKDINEILG